MTPLSHHEILLYVGPFSRSGRQVDLAQSNRVERKLVFKSVEHELPEHLLTKASVIEQLELDLAQSIPRLRRTLTLDNGMAVTLTARDSDLQTLLERVLAVAPAAQFRLCEGVLIGDSLRCPEDPTEVLLLRESCAFLGTIRMTLDARTVGAEPMTVRLASATASKLNMEFPDDLMAVLGRHWSVLDQREEFWKFFLHVPGRQPKRATMAKARFADTAIHLKRVLASKPASYHPTFRGERWRVWCRRLIPLAVIIAMLASLPLIGGKFLAGEKGFTPLAISLPNILFIAFMYVSRHEIPQVTIPPFPKALNFETWNSFIGEQQTFSTTPKNTSNG